MTETWIILGATSSMARALARRLAGEGAHLILAGRDMDDLSHTAADCRIAGAASARAMAFDATDSATFGPVIDAAPDGPVHCAVFVGSMPPQEAIDADPALIDRVTAENFTGPARFLAMLAPRLEARGGTVIGVASVAGDRGRVGNYVYGAAKAAFATHLSGLRARLARTEAHVMTVKPGFVDTAMTWGLPGLFLVAAPDEVARQVLGCARRRRNVIYVPFFWRGIMGIIRAVPEPVFKQMKV